MKYRAATAIRRALGLALLGFVSAATATAAVQSAAKPAKKVYVTRHVNPHAPVIDGKTDDPAWEKVEWAAGFIQREPEEDQPPTEPTSFKILYDDKNLYVAIRADDSQADRIERRISRRDNVEGDFVGILLDSYYDQRTAFCFYVNASGVKKDELITNNGEGEPDGSWDPIWEVKTAVDGQGWTAEMRIPFSQLRFGAQEEHVWGLEVLRLLFRKNETAVWQPVPRNAPGVVHLFGELRGINGLRTPRQVELMPYAVAKGLTAPRVEGNPFATGRSGALYGGLDGKVGVTNDLTMNFTVNPDFGQVEADPSVVNLTAFETYYEEKRPFFIEGRNILNFQIMGGDGDFSSDNLFYSRRIGRAPQGDPAAGPGSFAEMPPATSILGAFKLTGKTRSGLSIGVLESLTGRETASVFQDGTYASAPVEPLTNYFGLRLQKDFNEGTTILGGMATATNRGLKDESLQFLHGAAYSGGLDFMHSWRNKTYALSFNTVFSYVRGTADALLRTQTSPVRYFQRPDAPYLRLDPGRTSLSGHGGTATFGKQGGGNLSFIVGGTWRSPGLELNDMGYLRQADEIMEFAWAGYRFYKPFGIFRTLNFSLNQWRGWNFGGENIFDGGNINVDADFKNYWRAGFGINRNAESLSASALRGGPSLRNAGRWNTWVNVETDMRKKVRFELMGQTTDADNGDARMRQVQAGVVINPSRALSLSLMPGYATTRSELQYIQTASFDGEPRYIFGAIDQKTVSLTIRLNYSLNPELSVQFYGQPFIGSGQYSRFKRITDSRSRIWDARYWVFADSGLSWDATSGAYGVDENGDGVTDYTFGRPDFNFLQFRSNLVLRWEYSPGSALYLVWSQGRTGEFSEGDFSFGRDLGRLFDIHPENVFLVKFSYCFQL
jgi:Domain of unknown function (DUF5916)/Carbohydrate family 9 binding domain-like